MTWVRRDDQASIHRKVAPLDDACYRLWSEAIEWCSRNATDGRIAPDELGEIKRGTKPRAAKLVERVLWHVAGTECGSPKCPPSEGDGWVIHDYLDYNPSKAEVTAERAKATERQKRWRDKATGRYVDALPDALVASHETRQSRPPRPVPSRPEGTGDGKGSSPVPASPPPLADGARRSGDNPRSSARPCPTCGNAVDSAYHRNSCREDAA